MPQTVIRSGQNTYGTSVTGGTVPDANKIIDLKTWAPHVDPDRTPILSRLKRGTPRNQRPFYWGRSYLTRHKTTLASNVSSGATSIPVAAGDGVLFQVGSSFVLYDPVVGSSPTRYDYASKEQYWVTAISTDTLTVVPAQGGTTSSAHESGALIELLAPHEAQLGDHTISPVTRGDQFFNHFSRIGGGVRMDKAFRNTDTYEHKGDQLLNDMKKEMVRLKIMQEKEVIHGGRQAGNPSTPLPEMAGGFLFFITTNVYNQGGATLSAAALETAIRDLWNDVDDSASKELVMSMNTAAIFDTFLNPYRQAMMDTTQATYLLEKVKFRSGVYTINVSRWMPDGIIAIADFSEMQYIPYEGLDWHSKDHQTNGDYDWRSISTDFSLLVENESTMGLITNFNDDLSQYQGRNFLS